MAEPWTDPDLLGEKAETLFKQLKCGEPAVTAVEDNSANKNVDAVRSNPRPQEKTRSRSQGTTRSAVRSMVRPAHTRTGRRSGYHGWGRNCVDCGEAKMAVVNESSAGADP